MNCLLCRLRVVYQKDPFSCWRYEEELAGRHREVDREGDFRALYHLKQYALPQFRGNILQVVAVGSKLPQPATPSHFPWQPLEVVARHIELPESFRGQGRRMHQMPHDTKGLILNRTPTFLVGII